MAKSGDNRAFSRSEATMPKGQSRGEIWFLVDGKSARKLKVASEACSGCGRKLFQKPMHRKKIPRRRAWDFEKEFRFIV